MRELHDQLSRYVRHAAEGGEVTVTMRGKPVARLTPLPSADPLASLRARGLIREPTRPRTKIADLPRLRSPVSLSDIVIEQRRR